MESFLPHLALAASINPMLRSFPLSTPLRLGLYALFLAGFLTGCGESIQPEKTSPAEPKAYENNAMDTVGVAEGDKQVSPFGRPPH